MWPPAADQGFIEYQMHARFYVPAQSRAILMRRLAGKNHAHVYASHEISGMPAGMMI